jgi:hypothetical protein
MKFLLVVVSILGLMGCATMPSANTFESTEKLIDTVAFDTDCPKDQIQIVKEEHGMDWGRYNISACGKDLKYKRIGSVYMEASKDPLKQ